MATIEREINATEQNIGNLAHLQKLADAMSPCPKEWAYFGEVDEDNSGQAHCACGHNIRWLFPIKRERDGAVLIIGSTCIRSSIPWLTLHGAEGLAEALHGGLGKLEELLKERQRRIRENQGTIRYQAIQAKAQALHDWIAAAVTSIRETYRANGWQPLFLSDYFYRNKYKVLIAEPTATTPGRAAAGLEKRTQTALNHCQVLIELLEGKGLGNCLSPLPFVSLEEEPAEKKMKKEREEWERQDRAEEIAQEEREIAREFGIPSDSLSGKTYYPGIGPFAGQAITVREERGLGIWRVEAENGISWEAPEEGILKALEADEEIRKYQFGTHLATIKE